MDTVSYEELALAWNPWEIWDATVAHVLLCKEQDKFVLVRLPHRQHTQTITFDNELQRAQYLFWADDGKIVMPTAVEAVKAACLADWFDFPSDLYHSMYTKAVQHDSDLSEASSRLIYDVDHLDPRITIKVNTEYMGGSGTLTISGDETSVRRFDKFIDELAASSANR